MAVTLRVKRRLSGGSAGAPASLKTSELAYNETDDILYIGFGDDGGGNATSIKVLAGFGAFMRLVSDQTIAGIKTFSSSPILPTPLTSDDSTKAATTAFVKAAIAAGGGTWGSITGTISSQTDLVNYIATQISNLVNAAPAALDTLNELAAAIGNDANFATTITTALGTKADRTLSNLSNVATARTNLGLNSMALQDAASVAITGGTINGVVMDGGTF